MSKVLGSFTTITSILFLILLLIIYAFLPEKVGFIFSDEGQVINSISRNTFFYVSLFLFISVQLLFYLFNKFVLDRNYSGFSGQYLTIWFRGALLFINLLFLLLVLYLGLANNAVDYNYTSIMFVVYTGPVLLFIWILTLPIFIYHQRKLNRN